MLAPGHLYTFQVTLCIRDLHKLNFFWWFHLRLSAIFVNVPHLLKIILFHFGAGQKRPDNNQTTSLVNYKV
jgi:hypothetical protein